MASDGPKSIEIILFAVRIFHHYVTMLKNTNRCHLTNKSKTLKLYSPTKGVDIKFTWGFDPKGRGGVIGHVGAGKKGGRLENLLESF